MWGVWAPGVGAPCGGGAGAPLFAGQGLVAQVEPVRRCRRVLGGFPWCCLVLGGGRGLSAWWLPSHTLVLLVRGELWPGGVGLSAVVVVGVVLVVVVVGPLVVVALVVVGMVLRVWP